MLSQGAGKVLTFHCLVFTANLDRVFQFKTVGNGTVYFDNLYFWKAPAAQGTDTSLSDLTVNGSSIAGFGQRQQIILWNCQQEQRLFQQLQQLQQTQMQALS